MLSSKPACWLLGLFTAAQVYQQCSPASFQQRHKPTDPPPRSQSLLLQDFKPQSPGRQGLLCCLLDDLDRFRNAHTAVAAYECSSRNMTEQSLKAAVLNQSFVMPLPALMTSIRSHTMP